MCRSAADGWWLGMKCRQSTAQTGSSVAAQLGAFGCLKAPLAINSGSDCGSLLNRPQASWPSRPWDGGVPSRHSVVKHHPLSSIPVVMPSMLTVFLRFQYSLTPSGPIFSKYGTNSCSPRFPANCMIGTPVPQEV